MPTWLNMISSSCSRPVRRYARMNNNKHANNNNSNNNNNNGVEEDDVLLWGRELERHACGDFSLAVVQVNDSIEDYSQVETGSGATFVGVYDGHGGPDGSRFISDHLFRHFLRFAQQNRTISEKTLRDAFSATEDGFLTLVRRSCGIKPLIAAMGSCCLAGVIWKGTLHIANVGDSRAVIGYVGRSNKIFSEQLSKEHNASFEEVREDLRSSHPEDSQIVVMKHGVWRIKGIIQVSRSIGDAYLKRPEFSLDPSFPRFQLSEPLHKPVLTAEPSICSRNLRPNDKFIIYASDGLWEHLTNQKAVEIVHNSPREGISRKIKFCQLCGGQTKHEIPDGEEKMRAVCTLCGRIAFENPKMVVGCLIEHDNKILLCKRNIQPSFGLWTLPAGYMEVGESAAEGAIRETIEEAGADVEVLSPFAHLDIPLIGQTYIIFLARMKKPHFSPGPESSECRLFSFDDIPFDSLAFPSMLVSLKLYIEDRKAGRSKFHYGTINKRPGTSPSDIHAYTLDDHLHSDKTW